MAALSTVFYLIDDTNVASASAGGGAIPVCPDFVAPTAAAASQVAYLIASALQRSVRLVNKYYPAPPYTLVSPGPANTALTVAPSGVGIA